MPLLFSYLLFLISSCQSPSPEVGKGNQVVPSPALRIEESSFTRYPLLVSSDYGSSWQNGSRNLPDDISVSFLEQKGEEIVIATNNKGLWISRDQFNRWQQIGTELPSLKVNALHIDGDNVYVGVFRKGIYHSPDEGASWQSLNYDLPTLSIQAIYEYEGYLFVGTDIGIYRSKKGSSHWEAVHTGPQVLSMYGYNGKLVAGSSQGTLLSENGGKSWRWIRQEGAVHYTHNIGRRVYELVLNGDLIYSDDWGKTWQETFYQPREGSYVYEIVQVGDSLLLSNNYGVHRSADNGLSWNLIYPTEKMVFFDFLVINGTLYGGTRTWDEYRKRKR
ncbi:MAG: hypothetical protein AAF824_07895 [Bacteroidota bacterium]